MENKQFQTQFTEMLRNYPQAISERRKLIGLMHDLFPEEQMRVNLVMLAFDVGITEDLSNASTIDASIVSRCCKRMVQGHGVSVENAEWSAAVWCICYGGDILGKTVDADVSIPDYHGINTPSRMAKGKTAAEDIARGKDLVSVLAEFGISVEVANISHGPEKTSFDLKADPGVKITKLTSLATDIAVRMAVQAVRVLPSKFGGAFACVEIPNDSIDEVRLVDLLSAEDFQKNPSKTTACLGVDDNGKSIIIDIADMHHILMVGQTGSGKTACINSIIVSLISRAYPEEVRLILIDPRGVELVVYNNIPHLICPVVSDIKRALSALDWVTAEMTKRYKIFAERSVRDIKGYNKSLKLGEQEMPQIVVVIDELADLMSVSSKDTTQAISMLTLRSSNAGIHLVISTNRISGRILAKDIRDNMPCRIAFALPSANDSRTVISTAGAEKLRGKGDMLLKHVGRDIPLHVWGAWVPDDEIMAIVSSIKQRNEADYDPDMLEHMENATRTDAEKEELLGEYDPRLPEAVDIALDMGQVSYSMLQRRMRLGYARVGRLIDEMARRGIVSEADGAKPREVLITREQARELFEDDWYDGASAFRSPPVMPEVPVKPLPKVTRATYSERPQKHSSILKPEAQPLQPQKAITEQEEIKYPLHPQSRLKGDNYEIWVANNEINIHKILRGAMGGRIGQTDIHFTAGKIEALVIKLPRLFSKKTFIQFVFEKDVDVINNSGIKDDWIGDAMLTIPYPPERKKEFQTFMQQIADDMGIELEKE